VGERRSWLPFLRDNHVGLLGQNASNDSLPPSLSAASASADAVAGAGGGRGAAGAGGSTQNSGGASEVFKCGECGECVCQCQDLLDSNPTTSSSVSRYPSVSHPHALSRQVILSLAPPRSCQHVLVPTAPTRRTTDTTTQGLPWACAHALVKLSAPTSCRLIFDAMVLEATTSLTDNDQKAVGLQRTADGQREL
jgi:hypothetical protein